MEIDVQRTRSRRDFLVDRDVALCFERQGRICAARLLVLLIAEFSVMDATLLASVACTETAVPLFNKVLTVSLLTHVVLLRLAVPDALLLLL